MPFLDSTYIGDMITAQKRDALTPSGAVLNAYISSADAVVTQACARAGYTVNPATPPTGQAGEILKLAALYAYVALSSALRRDVLIPEEVMRILIDPDDIASGVVQLPGLVPSAIGSAGGASFENNPSGDTTTNYAPVFARKTMVGF